MKIIKQVTLIAILAILVMTGCDDRGLPYDDAIEGTYVGTISVINDSGKAYLDNEDHATAEVTVLGNRIIQVHLYNMDLDTIFMLNYYRHMDSVNVCFAGRDFENMYGHRLGHGHLDDLSMMGDKPNNESEWTHHLKDEHRNDDQHFGGFEMQNQRFDYRFSTVENNLRPNMIFRGEKS